MFVLCFFLGYHLNNKECSDSQDYTDGEADPSGLDEACKDEHHEGDRRHGDSVGELGGNVVNVVTLRTCRCHNRGIGDGGAVVAADSTRETCGDTDELEGIAGLEYAEDDGNKDSEGTPAGSGCERNKASNEENDSGKESGEGAGICHNALYELVASEKACGILKRVSEGKNEDRGNHCVEALGKSLHGVLEAHMTAGDHVNDDQHQGDKSAPRKTNCRVGVTE